MLDMLLSSMQGVQTLCVRMDKRMATLEAEVSSINATLATLPQAAALPGLSSSSTKSTSTPDHDALLASLRSDLRQMEASSQRNMDAFAKVNKSLLDSAEKRLKQEMASLSQRASTQLATVKDALDGVRARDVDLGDRVATFIKVKRKYD